MKRLKGYLAITGIYLLAFLAGALTYHTFTGLDLFVRLLFGTVVATLVIYTFSVLFKNSSIYDPYWSIQPLVILPVATQHYSSATVLMLIIVYLWGIRLTVNWAYTFKGFDHEDWRYKHYRRKHPRLWPLTNLFGIQLMPTLMVYIAMIPALLFVQAGASLSILIVCAALTGLIAIGVQLVADIQMHRFRRHKQGNQVMDRGLWSLSRHPNYFGEILFWFSLFFMYLSLDFRHLWSILFPSVMVILFTTVSIPLMEKRQLENKPDYRSYAETTNVLLPLPVSFSSAKEKRQIGS